MKDVGDLNRLINLDNPETAKNYQKIKDEKYFIEKLKDSLNRGENEFLNEISRYD